MDIGILCIITSKRKRFKAYARYIGEVQGEIGAWVGVEVPIPFGDSYTSSCGDAGSTGDKVRGDDRGVSRLEVWEGIMVVVMVVRTAPWHGQEPEKINVDYFFQNDPYHRPEPTILQGLHQRMGRSLLQPSYKPR